MNLQSFDILVAKSLSEGLTIDEQSLLDQIVKDDLSLSERYEQMKLAWEKSNNCKLLKLLDQCQPDDLNKIWTKIESTHVKSKSKIFHLLKFQNIAATVALTLLLSSFVLLYLNVPGFGRWVSYSTKGQVENVTLSDGTVVTLNEYSSVVYLKHPDNLRLVRLKGEGYFSVVPDSSKPFIVEAGYTKIRVVGTQFNLIVNQIYKTTDVFVTSGVVSFYAGKQKVLLHKNESGSYKDGKISKNAASDNNQLYWKTGELIFSNATLDEVLESLQKSFDTIKEIKKLNSATSVQITTKFENQSLDDIFKELELHFNKKFVLQNNILIISD
jgi:transmembrane sensor